MNLSQSSFTIPEILSLIGLAQCIYVLVYILFRAGNWRQALLPILYFFVLGSAFFSDFAARTLSVFDGYYQIWQWAAWFMGPPLSVLLIIQIIQIRQWPSPRNFAVLLLLPVAFGSAAFLAGMDGDCANWQNCAVLYDWLVITGLVAGLLSMAAIGFQAGKLEILQNEVAGKERYWLVIMLILANLLFLFIMLLDVMDVVSTPQMIMARTFLGLGFVYLAGTSLFRIYPQALHMIARDPASEISSAERKLAGRIETLLNMDKIYHEHSYSRADLARELDVAEATVSRVINTCFGKSFPQLLNERRVEDAKRMLAQTSISAKVIAQEVGFNSTASFNRVFRDVTGMTPSAYRKNQS